MRASAAERAVSHAVLVLFALQALVPIAYVLLLALGPQGAGQTGWGHVENFAAAWDQGHFSQYMRNSALVAVLVVGAALVLSLMSGYVLGILRPRGSEVLFYVFLLGIMVPSEAIVLPLFFDLRGLGLTDTLWAVALPQTAQSLAFGTFWMRAFFRGVDPAILEAARIDGAGDVRILCSVLLPIGRPAVVTQIVLTLRKIYSADKDPRKIHIRIIAETIDHRSLLVADRDLADRIPCAVLLPGCHIHLPAADARAPFRCKLRFGRVDLVCRQLRAHILRCLRLQTVYITLFKARNRRHHMLLQNLFVKRRLCLRRLLSGRLRRIFRIRCRRCGIGTARNECSSNNT